MKQIVQKGSRHEKRLGDKAYRYSTNKRNHRVDKYTSFSTLSYSNLTTVDVAFTQVVYQV
jgi:hypothetical protein